MFFYKLSIVTLFVLIYLKNINCNDTKNIVEIKNPETKNTNSLDLVKELKFEHEGASNNKNSSNINTQRIKARKSAIYNATSTSTTEPPIIKNDLTKNINNSINKAIISNNATTITTSRTPKMVTIPATNSTIIVKKKSESNVNITTTIAPPVTVEPDINKKHPSREGISDKPDHVNTNTSQLEVKTTNHPINTTKNQSINTKPDTLTTVKIVSTNNLNKTNENTNSTKESSTKLSIKANSTTTNTTTTTSTTTTATTATTTTTTTTTPKPKKPLFTISVEDMPNIDKIQPNKHDLLGVSSNVITKNNLQIIDEPIEQPNVEPSREIDDFHSNRRDYILPLVGIIFIIPIFMGFLIIGYRKFNDYWSTRHYRRMDFLVDGMYND